MRATNRICRIPLFAIVLVSLVAGAACATQGNVFSLDVGQCFNDDSAARDVAVSEVALVDCAEPHDSEVYGSFDLADGEYPGLSAVSSVAEEGCRGIFADYVGVPYDQSVLLATNFVPSKSSWDDLDDREVICLLLPADGDLVGTMRNSRR